MATVPVSVRCSATLSADGPPRQPAAPASAKRPNHQRTSGHLPISTPCPSPTNSAMGVAGRFADVSIARRHPPDAHETQQILALLLTRTDFKEASRELFRFRHLLRILCQLRPSHPGETFDAGRAQGRDTDGSTPAHRRPWRTALSPGGPRQLVKDATGPRPLSTGSGPLSTDGSRLRPTEPRGQATGHRPHCSGAFRRSP